MSIQYSHQNMQIYTITSAQIPTHALDVKNPFMLLKIGTINIITKVRIERKIMIIVGVIVSISSMPFAEAE